MAQQLSRRTFIKALGTGASVTPLILCGLTSAQAKPVDTKNRKHIKGVKMGLTDDEIAILNGRDGPTMAKVMRSVVAFGDAFDAPFLLDVQTPGHWVTGMGQKGLDALYDLADQLIKGGVKAKLPFTIDPYPMDYENIEYTEEEKKENADLYCFQKRWDEQVIKLGVRGGREGARKSYSCTCYLPEVGNRPEYGEVLAWAESSAVVYANSVIGARCNRNSGPMEMLCSMAGKTPYFGFLTDDARKAVWKIEVKTDKLPNAMLLGSAVGMKVGAAVPYITGLDKFLGTTITPEVDDWLKDFGAATASNGAVGLFHIENVTPEAKKLGQKLIAKDVKTFVVDDKVLADTKKGYPILWKDPAATPRYAFIGCPHCTRNQLSQWDVRIDAALKAAGKEKVEIPVIICASPLVIESLSPAQKARMQKNGIHISFLCGAMYMINKVSASYPCITNSNKLRTYSTARFYEDDELLEYVVTGKAPKAA